MRRWRSVELAAGARRGRASVASAPLSRHQLARPGRRVGEPGARRAQECGCASRLARRAAPRRRRACIVVFDAALARSSQPIASQTLPADDRRAARPRWSPVTRRPGAAGSRPSCLMSTCTSSPGLRRARSGCSGSGGSSRDVAARRPRSRVSAAYRRSASAEHQRRPRIAAAVARGARSRWSSGTGVLGGGRAYAARNPTATTTPVAAGQSQLERLRLPRRRVGRLSWSRSAAMPSVEPSATGQSRPSGQSCLRRPLRLRTSRPGDRGGRRARTERTEAPRGDGRMPVARPARARRRSAAAAAGRASR